MAKAELSEVRAAQHGMIYAAKVEKMKNLANGVLQSAWGLAAGAADLLMPSTCGACGSPEVESDGLCRQCARTLLSMVSLPYCPRCGATIGPNIPVRDDGCQSCPTVLPRYGRVIRLGPYGPPLRSVIRELKYRRREGMLRRLGQLLAEATAADVEALDVVVPVPMHWRRRLWRGYDHAGAIGGQVAKRLKLPVGDELIRVRYGLPQARLSRTKRFEAVRGAFELRSGATVRGARVLLVDDVTTTGATAGEAARTLLAGGVSSVILAVVAKAEPPTAYAGHWD